MGYLRTHEDDKRLKKLAKNTQNSCCTSACFDIDKNRYIRYSASDHYWKNRSNKNIRRYHGDLPIKSNSHRKISEYWWRIT